MDSAINQPFRLLLIIAIFSTSISFGQKQWQHQQMISSENGMPSIRSIATNPDGGFAVAGRFTGTLSHGEYSETSVQQYEDDAFVVSYNDTGAVNWIQSFGGEMSDGINGITSRGANYYVCGTFYDSCWAPSGEVLESLGGRDIFISSMNENGSDSWNKSGGSLWDDEGWDIAHDNNGNIYIAGEFYNTLEWDGEEVLSNAGSTGFFMQLNQYGDFMWGIAVGWDKISNIRFYDDEDLILIAGSSDSHTVAALYDVDGNMINNYQVGQSFSNYVEAAYQDDKLYILTLYSEYSPEFGDTNLPVFGGTDAVLACLDANSNVEWAVPMGGSNYDEPGNLTINNDSIYVTVWFDGNMACGDDAIENIGNYDGFIGVFDLQGNLLQNHVIGSSGYDQTPVVKINNNNEVVFAASTEGSTIIFPDTTCSMSNSGIITGIYKQMEITPPDTTSIAQIEKTCKIWYAQNHVHIQRSSSTPSPIQIFDIKGGLIRQFVSNSLDIVFPIVDINTGVYLVTVDGQSQKVYID